MAFDYVVQLLPCISIIVLLKLIYVIKVIQYLFSFRLVCCILHVADKHAIAVTLAYSLNHLNKEENYHLGESVTFWSLRSKLSAILGGMYELCISSFGISSSSSVQVLSATGYSSVQTSNSSFTLLDGGFLASHCSQYVGRCSLQLSHIKIFLQEVSADWVLKGLPSLYLTPLLGLALQSSCSKCLVLIPHRQFGNIILCKKSLHNKT